MSKSTTSTMISTSDVLITPEEASHSASIGGKARALAALHAADLPVPDWVVLTPVACTESLTEAQQQRLDDGPPLDGALEDLEQIGRASCRERVCLYV